MDINISDERAAVFFRVENKRGDRKFIWNVGN
jgi:hypothetical protein